MSTMTVRIHKNTHQSLKDLAQQTGEAMADVLAKAIDTYYRRQVFLQGLADDFAALRSDTNTWEEELLEREAWDVTLGDDLQ